jgi:tetratricopeptide (TPR) repeat protein
MRGQDRETALRDLGLEIGNLRTAWRHWVELEDLDQLFGLIDALWALHDARGWYHSAIELATDTLGVLANADVTTEIAGEELTIRIGLARALMAVKGYNLEVEEAFQRALEMSELSGSPKQKAHVLRALSTYYMNLSDMDNASRTARELLDLALAEKDTDIEVDGRFWYGMTTAFTGDPAAGIVDVDKAIALYDPRTYDTGRLRTGPSVGVSARVGSGLVLWQTGDFEEAISRVQAALDLARELDHPYSVAYALYHNGFLALSRSRFDECLDYAVELNRLSAEHNYYLWNALSVVLEGVADAALGRTEEGLAKTETAIEIYQGLTAPPVFWPLILSLRAVVNALAGNLDLAVSLISEAMEVGTIDAYPSFGVMRGDFRLGLGDHDGAEEDYRAAIDSAGRTGSRHAELVGRTHLVSLNRDRGVSPDGTAELAALYRTFTGGLDEFDMTAARVVIGDG